MYEPFTPDDMRARAVQARRSVIVLVLALAGFPLRMFVGGAGADDVAVYVLLVLAIGAWSLVCWVRWFHAIHSIVVARQRARFRGSWWLWAWLIPGVNVVLPKMMIDDLWRAADPPGSRRPLPPVVTVWWGCLVVATAARYLGDDRLPLPVAAGSAVISFVGLLGYLVLCVPVVGVLTPHAVGLYRGHRVGVEPLSTATAQPVR